jgi:hypothetical protein
MGFTSLCDGYADIWAGVVDTLTVVNNPVSGCVMALNTYRNPNIIGFGIS